jgi:hypothetical protein
MGDAARGSLYQSTAARRMPSHMSLRLSNDDCRTSWADGFCVQAAVQATDELLLADSRQTFAPHPLALELFQDQSDE